MTKFPKISIIVPVYNTGKYLKKCLDSLIYQTYSDLEIICIDDGSTDDSTSIISKYKEIDSRVSLYFQEHLGASAARNFGIEKATGDYVSFIDSDDWVFLTLYQAFIDYFEKFNKITPSTNTLDIYMFNASAYVKGQNDVVPKTFFDLCDWNNHGGRYAIHTFNDCMRPFSRNLSAANKIYRKDFLIQNKIIFPTGLKYEDQLFSIQTFLRAKSIMVNEDIFYRYRNMTGTSSTLEVTPRVFDIFKIVELVELELDDLNLYESYKYALFQYKFNTYAKHYAYCPIELKQKYYSKMKELLLQAQNRNIDSRIYSRLRNYEVFEKIINGTFDDFNKYITKLSL